MSQIESIDKPMITFNTFKDVIDFYHHFKKTEYKIKANIGSPHNPVFVSQGLAELKKEYENKTTLVVVKNEAVERFHPNNIDNKEFWTYAKTKFPKFSVCGTESKNISECNEKTLKMAKDYGFVGFIDQLINDSKSKLDFFEIGYGHGNIFFELKDKVNYLGIDFFKIKNLNKYKNLLTIEKSGIPDSVEKNHYDIVYSVNVLQHCSQHDRFEYIEQAYSILKPGGYMLGSCFMHTDENNDSNVWGVEDENGRRYCNFFNQLTEVDRIEEFSLMLSGLKFRPIDCVMAGDNYFFFVLQK